MVDITSKLSKPTSRCVPRMLLAVGLWMLLCCTRPAVAAPQLQASPALSTDGVTQLRWDLHGQPVELQRASNAAFTDPRTLYRGTDSASLRSGLVDGRYYYRLRTLDAAGDAGPWSAMLAVQVRHHSEQRAWGMFALGATVFLATLGLILWGGRRETADE